jgi:hypothetical protein
LLPSFRYSNKNKLLGEKLAVYRELFEGTKLLKRVTGI